MTQTAFHNGSIGCSFSFYWLGFGLAQKKHLIDLRFWYESLAIGMEYLPKRTHFICIMSAFSLRFEFKTIYIRVRKRRWVRRLCVAKSYVWIILGGIVCCMCAHGTKALERSTFPDLTGNFLSVWQGKLCANRNTYSHTPHIFIYNKKNI